MSSARYLQFSDNLDRSRELVGLGQSIAGLTVGRVDSTDMYRAALVQAVAALDAYVHGVVLDHAVDILLSRRTAGSKTQVGLHFGAVSELVAAESKTDLELRARAHVAERLGKETFQKPDDVAKAFAMVGIGRVWSSAFGKESGMMTQSLSVVVRRRNLIVHSCDVDPLTPGSVLPLKDQDVIAATETISKVVTAMDKLL